MVLIELLQHIAQGEGAKIEFKREVVPPEKLAKQIVAFANMNGGKIFLGVDDEGNIVGTARDNLQEWLMDTVLGRYVHPALFVDFDEVLYEGKKVAVITVPQGNAKPYVVQHDSREDVYVRYGNTVQLATREQLARLFASGGLLSVEAFPVHGSQLNELDSRRYEEYFNTIYREHEKPDMPAWLRGRDFLVGEEEPYQCSYLAYVMFAKSPQDRLPQAGVRVTVYKGKVKDYDMVMDEVLNVPIVAYTSELGDVIEPSLQERVITLLQGHVSHQAVDEKTLRRERYWDYPPEVIRELLVNALVHRDWSKPDYVRVAVYADRMEIKSPGALPNGMTIDKIKVGGQALRNAKCVRVFRDYGYLEEQGMGISLKVIPQMLAANGKEPEFEATEDYFKVTLWK